jgi:hypothetical protein
MHNPSRNVWVYVRCFVTLDLITCSHTLCIYCLHIMTCILTWVQPEQHVATSKAPCTACVAAIGVVHPDEHSVGARTEASDGRAEVGAEPGCIARHSRTTPGRAGGHTSAGCCADACASGQKLQQPASQLLWIACRASIAHVTCTHRQIIRWYVPAAIAKLASMEQGTQQPDHNQSIVLVLPGTTRLRSQQQN